MISDNAEVPVHFHFDCMIRWELVSMRVNFVKSSHSRPAVFAFLVFSNIKNPEICGVRIDFAWKIEYTNKIRNIRSDFCAFIKNQTDSYE